ncbi:MAG: glutamate mutase L, partial [Planctomycetaceae bacterium]|nr:glutamate mutase L [Planctomycetaceae bacterium]
SREALRLAYLQHREFATKLKGVQKQRTVGDLFSQKTGGESIVDNMTLDLLVASGGVLSHAPRMEQTVAMLIAAFEPEGFTRLAKDSIFMMPHLGVLASVHQEAALEVFKRDCLIPLGICIAPAGLCPPGQQVCDYEIRGDISAKGTLLFGELKRIPLSATQNAEVKIIPARQFDVGAGPGKPVTRKISGGSVGIILDARGRPLLVGTTGYSRQDVQNWVEQLDLYPGS